MTLGDELVWDMGWGIVMKSRSMSKSGLGKRRKEKNEQASKHFEWVEAMWSQVRSGQIRLSQVESKQCKIRSNQVKSSQVKWSSWWMWICEHTYTHVYTYVYALSITIHILAPVYSFNRHSFEYCSLLLLFLARMMFHFSPHAYLRNSCVPTYIRLLSPILILLSSTHFSTLSLPSIHLSIRLSSFFSFRSRNQKLHKFAVPFCLCVGAWL